ncbi:MAG: sulfotransferase [Planctomycetaceae bacterium]|nr:sulfotransferase [Planctomycetaceae bacterium]
MATRNSNFRDPFGLVMRMIRSGNRAAHAALLREALRYAAVPVDVVMSTQERRGPSTADSSHPLLLIVGAPRSGTSLVYQVLSRYLDVTYPSNASVMFPRSPITATRIQERFRIHRAPKYRSFYGQTCRLTDTNDAFEIWNRWLGDDRYHPAATLSSEQISDMRSFFSRWTHTFHKPLLNKNNRNSLAIRLLSDVLPQARFLIVRRNPVMVAQSLITARKRIQGDVRAPWGLEAKAAGGDPLGHVDAVCQQLTAIEQEMERQLQFVHADRVFGMTYEGFCEQPVPMIRSLIDQFDDIRVNPCSDLNSCQPFRVSSRQQVSNEELDRIYANFSLQPAATIFNN